MAKNLPTMWETWVQSLGQQDPVEKEMQPTPVFLPGESHGQRRPVDYSPWVHKESDTQTRLSNSHLIDQVHFHFHMLSLPNQCSLQFAYAEVVSTSSHLIGQQLQMSTKVT